MSFSTTSRVLSTKLPNYFTGGSMVQVPMRFPETIYNARYFPTGFNLKDYCTDHWLYVSENYGYGSTLGEYSAQALGRIAEARELFGEGNPAWTILSMSDILLELPEGAVLRDPESLELRIIQEPGRYLLYKPSRPCSRYALNIMYFSPLNISKIVHMVAAKTFGGVAESFFEMYGEAPVPEYGYELKPLYQAAGVVDGGINSKPEIMPYLERYLMAGAFGVLVDEPRRALVTRSELLNPYNQAPQRRIANIRQPL